MGKTTKRKNSQAKLSLQKKRTEKLQAVVDIEKALKQAEANNDSTTVAYLKQQLAEYKKATSTIKSNVVEYNGVKYRSSLEAYFAKRCDELALSWERQVSVELQKGFLLHKKEVVPPIKIRVDFLVEGFAFVDPKGMMMPDFEVKWNMLKNKFREDYEYFLPRNRKEIESVLESILNVLR